MPGVTGVNIYSILVAVVGAIVFLVIYPAIGAEPALKFKHIRSRRHDLG